MKTIDLNCDLGESFGAYVIGNDKEVLRSITSANIACGFHAGDPSVMRQTVQLAREYGVNIGAHPGFPDLVGFGRREMKVTPIDVYNNIVYQVGALQAFARIEGLPVKHVKPHGALYNMATKDAALAKAIAQAVHDVDSSLILYALANSELALAGEKYGLRVANEVFADRTYQADGSLTPRTEVNALITDENEAITRVIRMVQEGKVRTVNGTDIDIQADTVCVHGDGPKSLLFVQGLRRELKEVGIIVQTIGEHSS
ncbi:5-oxoprolinase subunit PxpA [Bacillus solimangrovi]|uniref:5-oxoprolinase subunit A n=1 Tax=Bacillus solimangrovi TaxID=1305675 RepID=A0A1E5LG03_9BACI|nr:5-oxoprolinase subunit PxpA [Bacillus solimangrovi]OEH93003.1 lactam utilization protein LamB [Bacillus solimangrovi]